MDELIKERSIGTLLEQGAWFKSSTWRVQSKHLVYLTKTLQRYSAGLLTLGPQLFSNPHKYHPEFLKIPRLGV